MEQENYSAHPQAESLLKRLSAHASGNFLRLPWPKNVITILCHEVLTLRARIEELERRSRDHK